MSLYTKHLTNFQKRLLAIVTRTWKTAAVALFCIAARAMIAYRTPSFSASDNPLKQASNFKTLTLSMFNVWSLHVHLLIFPHSLSFDWSNSVVIVEYLSDKNITCMFLRLILVFGLVMRCLMSMSVNRKLWKKSKINRLTSLFCVPKIIHTITKIVGKSNPIVQ